MNKKQLARTDGNLTLRLAEILTDPEEHYPGNFDTPQRANALLTGLCQDASMEIKRLQSIIDKQALAQPKAEQSPVKWSDYESDGRIIKNYPKKDNLEREWVDLSDDEILAAPENLIACIAYVRNKLKEKNTQQGEAND